MTACITLTLLAEQMLKEKHQVFAQQPHQDHISCKPKINAKKNTALSYKIKRGHRVLTPKEIEAALKEGKGRGLPDGWTVEWCNKKKFRIWISPDGKRRCDGIPKALVVSCKMGLLPREKMPSTYKDRTLTPEEVAKSLETAKKRGLPDGWTVLWDNGWGRKMWISPDRKRKCKTISDALAISVQKGYLPPDKAPPSTQRMRKLTPEEVTEALKEAKERGLPDGWNVKWDNRSKKKLWYSPTGRICHSIPEALLIAVKNGSISADKLPRSCQDRELSLMEAAVALKEAEEKGLQTKGWSVKWDYRNRCKKWISPKGKICYSIPRAIAISNAGSKPDRTLTADEKARALQEAKNRGLQDGWDVEWDNRHNCRKWIAPDGRTTNGIPQALAIACTMQIGKLSVTSTHSSAMKQLVEKSSPSSGRGYNDKKVRKRAKSSSIESVMKSALEVAKEKGLPDSWKIKWDDAKRRNIWVSGDGRKTCYSIPQAIAYSKRKAEVAKGLTSGGKRAKQEIVETKAKHYDSQ